MTPSSSASPPINAHSTYSYDQRSRVAGSVSAASGSVPAPPPGGTATAPGATAEVPDAADFRLQQSRAPMLDAAAASVLQQRGVDTSAIDPPGQTATPAPGHKIATWSRGPSTRTFDATTNTKMKGSPPRSRKPRSTKPPRVKPPREKK